MKNKIIAMATLFVMTFSFSACSGDGEPNEVTTQTVTQTATPSESESASDSGFPDLIRQETDNFDYSSDEDIISTAHSVCDVWADGGTIDSMFDIIVDSGVDAFDGGFLIGAATETFCPEYSYILEDSQVS